MSTMGDLLRAAADECLSISGYECENDLGVTQRMYSCDAVYDAVFKTGGNWQYVQQAYGFLGSLGVNTDITSQFNEFPAGVERQAVRHCWLYFAAMIADEWKVEL